MSHTAAWVEALQAGRGKEPGLVYSRNVCEARMAAGNGASESGEQVAERRVKEPRR